MNVKFLVLAFLPMLLIPAYGEGEHVVINEVNINPLGNDSVKIIEWVELYNPTDAKVDIGGWKILSTTVHKKTLTLPQDIIILPGQFRVFTFGPTWFTDVGESVELLDDDRDLVDKTPILSDLRNDNLSWQRINDGADRNSLDDWKYELSTKSKSNTKSIPIVKVPVKIIDEVIVNPMNFTTDKSLYHKGDILKINGTVIFDTDIQLVAIQIFNSDKTNFAEYATAIVNADGSFSWSTEVGGDTWRVDGIYPIIITHAGKLEKSIEYQEFQREYWQNFRGEDVFVFHSSIAELIDREYLILPSEFYEIPS